MAPSDIPSENSRIFVLQIDQGVAKKPRLAVPDSTLSLATKIILAK